MRKKRKPLLPLKSTTNHMVQHWNKMSGEKKICFSFFLLFFFFPCLSTLYFFVSSLSYTFHSNILLLHFIITFYSSSPFHLHSHVTFILGWVNVAVDSHINEGEQEWKRNGEKKEIFFSLSFCFAFKLENIFITFTCTMAIYTWVRHIRGEVELWEMTSWRRNKKLLTRKRMKINLKSEKKIHQIFFFSQGMIIFKCYQVTKQRECCSLIKK